MKNHFLITVSVKSVLISLIIFSCKTKTAANPEFSDLANKNQVEIRKVNNFRFLGGIANTEGKILKDSLIYRSGNLHHLKSGSFQDFEKLKITKVIDLRTKQEIASEASTFQVYINKFLQ